MEIRCGKWYREGNSLPVKVTKDYYHDKDYVDIFEILILPSGTETYRTNSISFENFIKDYKFYDGNFARDYPPEILQKIINILSYAPIVARNFEVNLEKTYDFQDQEREKLNKKIEEYKDKIQLLEEREAAILKYYADKTIPSLSKGE